MLWNRHKHNFHIIVCPNSFYCMHISKTSDADKFFQSNDFKCEQIPLTIPHMMNTLLNFRELVLANVNDVSFVLVGMRIQNMFPLITYICCALILVFWLMDNGCLIFNKLKTLTGIGKLFAMVLIELSALD